MTVEGVKGVRALFADKWNSMKVMRSAYSLQETVRHEKPVAMAMRRMHIAASVAFTYKKKRIFPKLYTLIERGPSVIIGISILCCVNLISRKFVVCSFVCLFFLGVRWFSFHFIHH